MMGTEDPLELQNCDGNFQENDSFANSSLMKLEKRQSQSNSEEGISSISDSDSNGRFIDLFLSIRSLRKD